MLDRKEKRLRGRWMGETKRERGGADRREGERFRVREKSMKRE